MKQIQTVLIGNTFMNIERYIYESEEMFYCRIHFIRKKYTSETNLENLISLSKIHLNKTFLNCVY
jgi:hypothetical protein